MGAAIKVTLLVLLIDVLIIYISSKLLVNGYSSSVELLNQSGLLASKAQYIARAARQSRLSLVSGDYDSMATYKSQMTKAVDKMHEIIYNKLVPQLENDQIRNYWYNNTWKQRTYVKR